MFIDDSTRLRHMWDAARKAVRFAQHKSRHDLETDEMLTLSLVKCIEIVGEAAVKVSQPRQAELTQIPWAQIISMRNRLVHAYFETDLDIVWNTVTQALPELIVELETTVEIKEQE